MEQIKDIFKQVRQAKGSLAFCKEEIINDTLYALADRVELLRTGFWKRTPRIWRRWIRRIPNMTVSN